MSLMDRRSFVFTGMCAAAQSGFATEAALPAANFPTDPRARLAVATYPFRARMLAPQNTDRDPHVPGMDLAHFARFVRAEFAVPGIEPLHAHFPSTELAQVRTLRAEFDAAGVHVVNIPVDEHVDLCGDPATRSEGQARLRRWIDIAAILRSPSIRIALPTCGQPGNLSGALQALQPTLDYAARQKIVVNLENDDPVTASAARIVAAIKDCSSPFLRALPDFANGLIGGDEAFNASSVQSMFGYAWNIAHVKDAEVIGGKREGVDLRQLFNLAKRAGYRGYYSMESDSNVDPVADTRHLIAQSLAML